MSVVIATAHVKIEGKDFMYFFLEGGRVMKYDIERQVSWYCTNLPDNIEAPKQGINISPLAAGAMLGAIIGSTAG